MNKETSTFKERVRYRNLFSGLIIFLGGGFIFLSVSVVCAISVKLSKSKISAKQKNKRPLSLTALYEG